MALVYKIIILSVLITFFSESYAKIAPDYVRICPGLKSECLKDNIQNTIPQFVKGVPSLGLNSTDPLRIDYLKLNLPGGLAIEFFNGDITGMRNCRVESVKYENLIGDLVLKCDLNIKGKYKATGKILLFNINGDGDAKIKIKEIIVTTKMFFADVVRDGVEYRDIKSIKTSYRFKERVSFLFTNLFKGNDELSKTILTFINENWKEVLEEVGKPVVDAVIQLCLDVIKKFFKVIPKNELIS